MRWYAAAADAAHAAMTHFATKVWGLRRSALVSGVCIADSVCGLGPQRTRRRPRAAAAAGVVATLIFARSAAWRDGGAASAALLGA
jgi:hypothetical protein